MKISLENGTGYSIRSYREGQVEVVVLARIPPDSEETNSVVLTSSAIITPDRLIENWPPRPDEPLSQDHLETILAIRPELIILGTGVRLVFPNPAVLQVCYQAGIGIEVMDNGAACRTYNVLAAEGRQVALGLML